MIRKLQENETVQTSMFGGFCPYWTMLDGQVLVADTAREMILELPKNKRIIDPAGVMELLQFNYMLGNRTLIQNVQKMPWHAVLDSKGNVYREAPILHKNDYLETDEIAKKLLALLEKDLYKVVQNRKQIYLLLSGGLDSRIIAGLLKRIEKNLTVSITCVTWGLPDSRDVNYAKKIADWFNWECIALSYDAELIRSNITKTALWGVAEVAGIHLHGLDWFKNVNKDDVVIGAIFGDSIGRAEFSSKHLKELSVPEIKNPYKLIKSNLSKKMINIAKMDQKTAWEEDISGFPWAKAELDLQENYMRRMLRFDFDYVLQFCDMYQAFTDDDTVSFMWSLSPECRTDDVYTKVFYYLDPRLKSLPWARDGIAPDGTRETNLELTKHYHEIGKWLRQDLKKEITELVFSKGLHGLNLFNNKAITQLYNDWEKEPPEMVGKGQNLVKLASIELARREYGILPYENDNWFYRITSRTKF